MSGLYACSGDLDLSCFCKAPSEAGPIAYLDKNKQSTGFVEENCPSGCHLTRVHISFQECRLFDLDLFSTEFELQYCKLPLLHSNSQQWLAANGLMQHHQQIDRMLASNLRHQTWGEHVKFIRLACCLKAQSKAKLDQQRMFWPTPCMHHYFTSSFLLSSPVNPFPKTSHMPPALPPLQLWKGAFSS